MTNPAMVGPMKRAVLKVIELRATATGRSSRGTRFEINDSRAGWAKAWMTPWVQTSAASSQMVRLPVKAAIVIAAEVSMERPWVSLTMARRSRRSTSAPPIGPKTVEGNSSMKASAPIQAPEWVSSQASQPAAMRWIQVPTTETLLPIA